MQRETCSTSGFGVFSKLGLQCCALAMAVTRSIPSSSWGGWEGGGSALGGLRAGYGRYPTCHSTAELGAGAMGSREAHLSLHLPDMTVHSWHPWGNIGVVHKQVRQLHTGKPREKPFRGKFPNPGRRKIRKQRLTNPWSVPPNKLTVQDTTGS